MSSGRPVILTASAALAALSLLAACGGKSAPGVASVGPSTSSGTAQGGLVAFSRCMRANGVPGFPDPDGSEGIPKAQVIAASQANPQAFNAAQAACSHLLPNGSLGPTETAQQVRIRIADWLSFVGCMHRRGVARFPDPTSQGRLTVAMVEAQGIDLHSPLVLRAVETCLPASRGLLTPAKVAEALRQTAG